MLFDPCGDLLKDYGAYCETLRVTEREDVYSAIHARSVDVPQVVAATGISEGDGADGRAETEDGRGGAGSVSSPKSKSQRKSSRTGERRKSSLKSSADGVSGAAPQAVEAVSAPAAVGVTLTSIKLHYPVFCLNQRDMTPLCRAIPHCPSLLSVELVGCGLSVQSYMKLVEAVYRSPRVISVAVDFNVPFIELKHQRRLTVGKESMEAGFVVDPTLHPSSYSAAAESHDFPAGPLPPPPPPPPPGASPAVSQEPCFNASAAAVPPRCSVTSTLAAMQRQEQGRSESVGEVDEAAGRPVSSTAPRLSQISSADVAGATGVNVTARGFSGMDGVVGGLPEDDGASAVLYLYPTQYCGLDQQPTPLELQLQEEKEKKGKVDGKKVQQLQAQRETLRAFDQQHRIPVPKAWDGILFTGIHQLSLRGNHIDDATAGRLAQVLLDHSQSRLASLNLWGNHITDVGAAALARMLRTNRVLQVLDLGHNELSDVGLLELMRVFLMQQVTSPEEVATARRAYLTRRGASEEEQKAANQPLVLADIPSYEDLYAHWWHMQQQAAQLSAPAEANLSPADAAASASGSGKSPRPTTFVPAVLPAPPVRDTQSSPTAAGNLKRTPPVKNKTVKSESATGAAIAASAAAAAAFNTTMSSSAARAANRRTIGFDKDCVRVHHTADNDTTIRIPGNTVLEVLNLEENRYITIAGAREAARLLRLREPADAAEMLAMVEQRETPTLLAGLLTPPTSVSVTPDDTAKRSHRPGNSSGVLPTTASANVSNSGCAAATVGTTVIHAPELHCAGLRLRMCCVRSHREACRAAWPDMDAAQEELNAALAMWTAQSVPA